MADGFTRRDAAPTKGSAMSTATPEAPAEPTTTATTTTPEGAKPEAEELGEKGIAALKSERKAREAAEKTTAELVAELKALKDKDKTDTEKAAEALETTRKELAELTTAKTRAEVAANTAVPTALLAGPASNSPEDITAFAEALIAFRGEQKQTPSSTALGRVNTTTPDLSTPVEAWKAFVSDQLSK